MTNPNLPTKKQCLEMLGRYHVPENIKRHCLTAAKLALFLAERLRKKGIGINIALVESACLLHDIARVCDIKEFDYTRLDQPVLEQDKIKWQQIKSDYKGYCHEDAACEILKQDYPDLAETIRRHRYTTMLSERDKPQTWEQKIVYYADMRVLDDKIVPLEERLRKGHKRNVHMYPSKERQREITSQIDPLIFELEKEIFQQINLDALTVSDEFINSYSG